MKRLLAWVAGAAGGLAASRIGYAQAPFADVKSRLKITGVRLVQTRPRRPVPAYTPTPGSWSTNQVEVANPMSIYPEYKATRSLFLPDPGKVPGSTVEISTDKGIKGYGSGGPHISPELSMQQLVWSEKAVHGGKRVLWTRFGIDPFLPPAGATQIGIETASEIAARLVDPAKP